MAKTERKVRSYGSAWMKVAGAEVRRNDQILVF